MTKKGRPTKRRDRYDVSGNVEAEYVDAQETVLKNKKGITDLPTLQLAEEAGLVRAYRTLLAEVRMDTPMTCELLRHVHARIFGDLYDWAGRWRTVWISKPGTTWPPPDFLDQTMEAYERDVLRTHPAVALQDDHTFCAAVAAIQGEFLVIHPFREGNARTIKLLANLLAAQTGRPILLYDQTDRGTETYIAAAKAAFGKDYDPMTAIIRDALDRARRLG
jgi:cell filamentation protein